MILFNISYLPRFRELARFGKHHSSRYLISGSLISYDLKLVGGVLAERVLVMVGRGET